MKYEKATAKTIDFSKQEVFMFLSGGDDTRQKVIDRAMNEPAVLDAKKNDNWGVSIDSIEYNPLTGTWFVTVLVSNPAGNNTQTFEYNYV